MMRPRICSKRFSHLWKFQLFPILDDVDVDICWNKHHILKKERRKNYVQLLCPSSAFPHCLHRHELTHSHKWFRARDGTHCEVFQVKYQHSMPQHVWEIFCLAKNWLLFWHILWRLKLSRRDPTTAENCPEASNPAENVSKSFLSFVHILVIISKSLMVHSTSLSCFFCATEKMFGGRTIWGFSDVRWRIRNPHLLFPFVEFSLNIFRLWRYLCVPTTFTCGIELFRKLFF